jgi:hypothetical protein
MTTITALPAAPNRSTDNASTYVTKADAMMAALPTFVTETNTVAGEVNTNATSAAANAIIADASATAAASSVNAAAWVSGNTYTTGQCVYSPIDYQTYRHITASSSLTTDPSLDTTNWTKLTGSSGGISAAASVSTNTTLTSSSSGLQRITATNYGLIMKLPDATTLSVGGPKFILDNTTSAYPVKVVNNADTLLGFIPAGEVSYVSVSDISTAAGVFNCSNLRVIGCSAQLATVLFASITSVVDLGSGRELIVGGTSASSTLYCVMYTRTTNTFSSVVSVRAGVTSVDSQNAAILQSADKVLVVSCSNTTALEAVVIDTSGATPVVKTAATATLSANIGGNSFSTDVVAAPLTLTDSGSVLFSYNVATPAAQIRAISVSGFTTTIGAATTLDGTQGANSTAGGLVMAATGGVIAVSVATTNLYTKYYGVSGSSITTGSGTTTAGGTMTLNKATALGSRWGVLYNDGGTTCKGGIVSLSGTTTSISVATLFSAGTFTDAAVIGSTKILVHNGTSSSNANILTDSSGTASAGTAITINSDSSGTRVIANISGNTAYTQSGQSNQYISKIDCSGASPVLSSELISAYVSNTEVPTFSTSAANFAVSKNCIRGANYASTISVGTSTVNFRSELMGDIHSRAYPYLLHNSAVTSTRGRNNSERWARDASPYYTIAKIECVQ